MKTTCGTVREEPPFHHQTQTRQQLHSPSIIKHKRSNNCTEIIIITITIIHSRDTTPVLWARAHSLVLLRYHATSRHTHQACGVKSDFMFCQFHDSLAMLHQRCWTHTFRSPTVTVPRSTSGLWESSFTSCAVASPPFMTTRRPSSSSRFERGSTPSLRRTGMKCRTEPKISSPGSAFHLPVSLFTTQSTTHMKTNSQESLNRWHVLRIQWQHMWSSIRRILLCCTPALHVWSFTQNRLADRAGRRLD
jgi:hypothetical protein